MNDRLGDYLWSEWDGELLNVVDDRLVYYTHEHVDLSLEIVKRALASALQRDGVVDSLLDAFKLLEKSEISHGWVGVAEGDLHLTACEESGETHYGDVLGDVLEATFVELG